MAQQSMAALGRKTTVERAETLVPWSAEEMEQLGMQVIGFVQLVVGGQGMALPVGLLPKMTSDRSGGHTKGGFFTDERGGCGIVLEADQPWQVALTSAVDEARSALGISVIN